VRTCEMIDDVTMLVDFEGVENLKSNNDSLRMLQDVRNDMIGCQDTKMAYYERGLIETIVPLLEREHLDNRIRNEIYVLLNSFLIGCPKALEALKLFREKILTAIDKSLADNESLLNASGAS